MPLKLGDEHEQDPKACLACGNVLDRASEIKQDVATELEGNPPTPDEYTICFNCGHIMAFDEELHFRELTEKEIFEVASNSEIQKMKRMVIKFRDEMSMLKPLANNSNP